MRQLLIALACLSIATPSHAFFTACTVIKDTAGVSRPGGKVSMPRWAPLGKGSKIVVMDTYRGTYQDWAFVLHRVQDHEEYKWVPRDTLSSCHKEEGTP